MSQTKKSWQMTTEEFYQFTKKNLTHPMTQRAYKKIPDWFTKERQLNIHYQIVRDALAEGKSVPAKVLKKYPDLIPKKPVRRRKQPPYPPLKRGRKPLPKGAQFLSFNEIEYGCYGIRDKRGTHRVYCRLRR